MNTNFYLDLIKNFKIISRETWIQIENKKELIEMKKSLTLEKFDFHEFLQTIAKNICYTLKKHPDSPVFYLLFQEEHVVCCKVSFCEENHLNFRKACLMDEIYNLKILSKHFQGTPWACAFQIPIDLEPFETTWQRETYTFSFSKYVPSFQHPIKHNVKCCNLREYAVECSDVAFRAALFQVIAALIKLQNDFPGYRHNDLKCDNVLVTNIKSLQDVEDKSIEKGYRFYDMYTPNGSRLFKIPLYAHCVLIDFESSWWTERKPQYESLQNLTDIKNRFGIYNFPCAAFDIHLLCMDLLRTFKHKGPLYENSDVSKNLYLFLMDFFMADSFQLKNLQEFRLFEKHQRVMNINIQDMLLHPYFFGYRHVTYEEKETVFCL